MPRQVVHLLIQLGKRRCARMRLRQPGLPHLLCHTECVRKITAREQIRESIEHVGGQVQYLAKFTRGTAAPVGNDRRRHRRPVGAITTVNFLDDALAPVAARQIDIDVRPSAMAFAEESLEKNVELHRVHGGNAKAKTDCAVSRAAASLRQNIVLATKTDEVGDNEGKIDAAVEGDGVKIAFNTKYLQDVLQALDGQIALETTGPSSQGVFKPFGGGKDDYVHVIMPMFVQW